MVREIQTFVTAKTIRGTSFVGIRDYINSKDEVSNQTILVGASYENAKAADIETARNFDLTLNESSFSESLQIQAKEAIIESMVNPRTANSEGQTEAYKHIAPGLKVHIEKQELYVFGFVVSKTVIEPGNYPHKNSRELTLAKNEMKKQMELKTSKYRQFSLGKIADLRIEGLSL